MTWKSDSIARHTLDSGNRRFLISIPRQQSKSGIAVFLPLCACRVALAARTAFQNMSRYEQNAVIEVLKTLRVLPLGVTAQTR